MSGIRELELLLYEHPAVWDVAILAENTEKLSVFVQPRSGKYLNPAELALFCRNLSEAPKDFYIVKELPKTKTGKVYREVLLDLIPSTAALNF